MNPRLKGYLILCRPPNLPTAAADVIAGMAIAGVFSFNPVISVYSIVLIVLSSIFLYACGVVLNDVFDAKLDEVERPERPIPSGVISLKKARSFGFGLLVLGIICALLVNRTSGMLSFILALSIVCYDAFSKKNRFLGPLNMGICRGLNLLLGISILQPLSHMEYTVIPIVFIAAITLISRGEVHGNNKKNIVFAGFLYVMVLFLVIYLHAINLKQMNMYMPFLALFAIMVLFPLVKAYLKNTPKNIKGAVISGVLGIILLDAALATAYSNWVVGLLILMLLPISIFLSRIFAVT